MLVSGSHASDCSTPFTQSVGLHDGNGCNGFKCRSGRPPAYFRGQASPVKRSYYSSSSGKRNLDYRRSNSDYRRSKSDFWILMSAFSSWKMGSAGTGVIHHNLVHHLTPKCWKNRNQSTHAFKTSECLIFEWKYTKQLEPVLFRMSYRIPRVSKFYGTCSLFSPASFVWYRLAWC